MVEWGPGDHVQRWRNGLIAHEFIAAYGPWGYHVPGPGETACLAPIESIAAPGDTVIVVNRSWSVQETYQRLYVAGVNCGVEWSVWSNCQDFCSVVVTGKMGSFQREAALAILALPLMAALAGELLQTTQPRRRSKRGL